ncbi:hypothetical protein PTNB73_06189 [Pyrenophora teres f. teres]|nr:hypothetical protein PTNB85_07869 [Pyrenophora teres f. teres]KAE8841818.1 hypothetical protein HRS9122_05944 [Pyrenophora teres f. teres]KAE8865301.1 hypothetical protein PTNB73_06189 [Pyrenophora teres f. teres]
MSSKEKTAASGSNSAGKQPDPKIPRGHGRPVTVNWGIPRLKTKAKNRQGERDHRHVTAYARTLYNRPPEDLTLEQSVLPDAQLRTPIYQKVGAKDLPNPDPNQSSTSLRGLFNTIKARSVQGLGNPYQIHNLSRHFADENADENTALVLSRAVDAEILVLDQNRQLEVTVGGETARIQLIRQVPADEGERLGYFIELPRNTSVTVNGNTYTNSDDLPDSPFYIGPLEGYAVIELLSQPVFFFRDQASLKHTASHRAAQQDEIDRRDQRGEVPVEDTEVRWQLMDPPGGNDPPVVPPEVFSDEFTDDGEPIEDVCAYTSQRLPSAEQIYRYIDLIPRILTAVNYRQPRESGFSYIRDGWTFRPGRTLLLHTNNHRSHYLVTAQIDSGNLSVRIIDPMAWSATTEVRQAVYQAACELIISGEWWRHQYDSAEDMAMPEYAVWVPCAQATTREASSTYTVLNAWALAMGLEPDPAFTPSQQRDEAFFIRAQHLFNQALEERLTWKLLFAFFRCTGFVKRPQGAEDDGNLNLPPVAQRFDQSKHSFEELVTRQVQADEGEDQNYVVEYHPLGLEDGIAHNAELAWDSLTDVQRSEVVHLIREGQWNLRDTADQLRDRLEQRNTPPGVDAPPVISGNTTPTPPEIPPCEYLRQRLNELLADEDIATDLRDLRFRASTTTELGAWPLGEETAMYVYAVLMAINNIQGPEEGFSVAPYESTQAASLGEVAARGIRPGRPLIVPHIEENHNVLLVMQLEEKARPAIYVLDSLYHYYNRDQRTRIFNDAWLALVNTDWFIDHFNSRQDFENHKPQSAIWVKTASQSGTNECGYYSVLNAWGIALGLELDPHVTIRWTDEFFQTMQDVLHLARLGYADWRLIHAFLRCHGIVRDGVVPENRRFPETYRTADHMELYGDLGMLRDMETMHRQENPPNRAAQQVNRVHRLRGQVHNEQFRSDRWTGKSRTTYVPRLQRLGRLQITDSNTNLERAWREWELYILDQFQEQVPIQETASANVTAFRTYMTETYTTAHIQASPHDWASDAIRSYRRMMETAEIRDRFFGNPRATAYMDPNAPLDYETVNLAIVSVLEAIDTFQQSAETPNQDFAGGFTLTTSTNLDLGAYTNDFDNPPFLSRPRRTWLMPLVIPGDDPGLVQWCKDNKQKRVSGHGQAHTFLALLQEEREQTGHKSGRTHYKTYLFDSSPRVFRDVRYYLHERIQTIARHLLWTPHRINTPGRNNAPEPQFGPLEAYPVAQQSPGGWQCGYHTIINAWIIALGLHPDPKKLYSEAIYNEAYKLIQVALAGILDWRTLAAWITSRSLSRETDFSRMPEHRRFSYTEPQTNETELGGRIETVYALQDALLSSLPQAAVPYLSDNNFDGTAGGQGKGQGQGKKGGLNRAVDDRDLVGWTRRGSGKRKRGDAGLEVLGKPWKRQRVRGDVLVFLDVY